MADTHAAHSLTTAPTAHSVEEKIRHFAALERTRLFLMNGTEPTQSELHAAVEDAFVAWCESWFSEAEKALPQEAKDTLARTWLKETGVLATLDLI